VRNVSSKFVEKFKTLILCSIISFPDKLIIYEIMWKDIVEPDRPTDGGMAHALFMLDI
jgi:hypothetical protein